MSNETKTQRDAAFHAAIEQGRKNDQREREAREGLNAAWDALWDLLGYGNEAVEILAVAKAVADAARTEERIRMKRRGEDAVFLLEAKVAELEAELREARERAETEYARGERARQSLARARDEARKEAR